MNLAKKILRITILSFFIFAYVFSAQAAGDLDPSFNPSLIQMTYSAGSINKTVVERVVVQPDGKVLIAGNFTAVGKFTINKIARFNADGTVDTTFRPPAILPVPGLFIGTIYAVALQTDGKILIGGDFVTVGGVSRPKIARLNSDGSLDLTFGSAEAYNLNGTVSDIKVGGDNKITFGGSFIYNTPQNQKFHLARVFADGTLDTTLNPQGIIGSQNQVFEILLLPGDKTLISLSGNIIRLNANNTVEFSIPIGGVVERFARQADGKILVGGSFNTFNGFPVSSGIVRLNTDDSIDTSFTPPSGISANDIEILAGGKILVGGGFTVGTTKNVILLNSDGTVDNSLNYTGVQIIVRDLGVQSDSKILVGGEATELGSGGVASPLTRLNANGSLDSMQIIVGNIGRINKIFIQPDGKILVGGFFTHAAGTLRNNLARFNADGTLDLTFSPSLSSDMEVLGIDAQPDGVILVSANISFRKLSSSGETLFAFGGFSYDIKPLPDGRLLLSLNNFLRRVNVNNSFDFSFDVPTNNPIRKILIQPDGKILVAGVFTTIRGETRGRIARLNADGTLDASFNPSGGANDTINDIALQPDGKIIIVGAFTGVNFNTNYKFIARLNTNGMLDTGFNPIVNGEVTSVKLQPDGKILFGGNISLVNGISLNGMARLNTGGSLDTTFSIGSGTDNVIRSIELQAGNKILIGGEFKFVNGTDRLAFARLSNDLPLKTIFDYDGDGKADVSVFRPSENKWYIFQSSNGQVVERVFAIAGDKPVPADFDGDGKTDVSIFRQSLGDWWSLSSTNSNQVFTHWGANGDIPRPSDFDGDGRADYIVFRAAENNWYRVSSATGISSTKLFGAAGDKPVTGDFDGDGKSDVAIYRPSTGEWWWQSSIDNVQRATRWGISTDIPTPADFDGDGKTDFAVYRPSTGGWYVINSSTGSFTIMSFGLSEDKPVAADYDGDGKADIAVFRPSTGVWYLMRSTAGFTALQFGVSTDIPTQNSFVP